MAETRPYQFGDVVDGYRWTVVGWERVDPPAPVVPAQSASVEAAEPTRSATHDPREDEARIDLETLFARTMVVAPDLVVELDEPVEAAAAVPAVEPPEVRDEPSPSPVAGPGPADDPANASMEARPEPETLPEASATTPLGAADPWRGFDWSALRETEPPVVGPASPEADEVDASFAAALSLGAEALARTEEHRGEPETGDAGEPDGSAVVNGHRWTSGGWEPIDEWTTAAPEPAPVILTEQDEPATRSPYRVEPFITYTDAPAAGWYPGSTPSD